MTGVQTCALPICDCVETRRFSLDAPLDLRGCGAVVHLAGESVVGLWTRAKLQRIRESRVLGTRRVVEGIRALAEPPEVFVSASAIGFYADSGDAELTELSPSGTGYFAETCRAWESEAATPLCRVVNARIGHVLGDGGMLRLMRPAFRLCLGGRLGDGRQWMPWIHVEDLAEMILFAIGNLDVRGPLNGTAPWPVRNADFTRALARALHRPAFLHTPAWVLRLVFRQFAADLLASKRVLPAAATGHGFGFRFPELEPALNDLIR